MILSLSCVSTKVGKPSRSKHNILPSGSLQFVSLSKEDHGEWECVATNVVTSITASTRILVIGKNKTKKYKLWKNSSPNMNMFQSHENKLETFGLNSFLKSNRRHRTSHITTTTLWLFFYR